ncbi:uncharacterized protein EV420DRAFT_1673449 [Desarmillaria tabescens]|uniref:F-box domain-containing protein n=1 Tax=Armillaria tabescens TaxID=1929756 RepID=A0AA39KHU1_ARMTA|nr:uncharacterized protein EV420DRAFT_1673449 [Desarmillaria tabescens]KAK0460256.1 hypothetical protein EV420DRAFT_1673449 [Desarmillaria tabescens]
MACHVWAVGPAVPYWDLVPVPTPTNTNTNTVEIFDTRSFEKMDQRKMCPPCGGKGYLLPKKTNEELRRQLGTISQSIASTPNSHLLPEVLSQIFGLALGGDFFNMSETHTGPWALSHVCSSWRSAACGDPTIWTSILIDDSSVTIGVSGKVLTPCPREDPPSLLSTILSRSNQRDINIVFNISVGKVDFTTKRTIKQLFQIVMRDSKRWNDVSICVPCELIPMLEAVEGNVPRLSKLHIGTSEVDTVHEGPGVPPTPSPLVKAFNEAPALKEVSFDRLSVENTVLPRSQIISLTDIRKKYGRSKILVKILSLSPHLKALNFNSEIPEDYNHFQSWTDKIVHAELQSLTTCSTYFMKKMKFPRLTSLTVRPQFEERGDVDDAINTLITSSQCSLRYLHIEGSYMTDLLFQTLASTPELTQLELCFLRWDYEYAIGGFEQFTLRMDELTESGHHRIIPLLESLKVVVQRNTSGTSFGSIDSVFTDMAVSRWNCGALKSLLLEAETDMVLVGLGIENTTQLRTLKDEGFDISICTTTAGSPYTSGHWDARFVQEDYRRIYVWCNIQFPPTAVVSVGIHNNVHIFAYSHSGTTGG